ncbi:MAG: hypothetical protein U5K69_24150 [Balneolaceae bacterium]|nr:hypothetical protein [Balneolaceae bacterium]
MDDLLNFRAYHLFIQGPYPIYDKKGKRKVEDWGRAWYLYDGDQAQFTKSMEVSSEFIQEILDNILNHVEVEQSRSAWILNGSLPGWLLCTLTVEACQ